MTTDITPEAAERARFEAWANGKFEHIAEHMRWVTISIAEEGWMARAALAAQVPHTDTYEAICEHLAHAIPCYQRPTGCIREGGCEERCQMLLAYQEGYRAAQEGGGERVTERWEPMETAPMDGTVIQFLQGGEVFAGFAGDDPDHPWQFLDRNVGQAFVNGFHHKFSPRWWRPLAEAPKEAALRAAQEGTGNG